MAYRFSETGSKRYVAWEDLALEIEDGIIKLYDKTEPDVCITHVIDYAIPLPIASTPNETVTDYGRGINNRSKGMVNGMVPTWSVPDAKIPSGSSKLASIWIPLA